MVRRGVAVTTVVLSFVPVYVARADRTGDNKEPAWVFYKQGRFFEAAMYYHRALRGLREIYLAFHWNGDPVKNASQQFAELYGKLPKEIEDRVNMSLVKGNIGQTQRRQIELLGELWMGETVDYDRGDMTTCCPILAPEAERHGDFTAAEVIRRGEAHFYRAVAIPYHEKTAEAAERRGEKAAAALHRKVLAAYQRRAAVAERIARGNKVLMEIPLLVGPGPVEFGFYPKRGWEGIPNEYVRRRWWGGKSENRSSNDDISTDRWKGPSAEQVAAILKAEGLKQGDEDARFAAVTVLANLGEKEALLSALNDASADVRLAAAKALASMRWAKGWAACHRHADKAVRAVVVPLLEKPQSDIRCRTFAITALIEGLNSKDSATTSFCQNWLERITGKGLSGAEMWSAWWKQLGDARLGLKRTGGGIPEEIDEKIDFGTWWQAVVQHALNPLKNCQPPATVRWDGYLVVTRAGTYHFFIRNRGEGKTSRNTAGGRAAQGLYFPAPAAKLTLDGKTVIPKPGNEMLDPTGGMRMDFSDLITLDEGLHKISLEFEWRGGHTQAWWHGGQPEIRLYWSSDHFLRELVPAHHLVTMN